MSTRQARPMKVPGLPDCQIDPRWCARAHFHWLSLPGSQDSRHLKINALRKIGQLVRSDQCPQSGAADEACDLPNVTRGGGPSRSVFEDKPGLSKMVRQA